MIKRKPKPEEPGLPAGQAMAGQPKAQPEQVRAMPVESPASPAASRSRAVSETRFELMMYQLVLIVIIGMLIALGIGYFIGKEVGVARAINLMDINAPDYCLTEVKGSNISVRCSEMNMTLDEMCGYMSPAMKSRIKIMLVTGK